VKRVLFVRLSAMGDVVQSLGAVAALHRERPDLELFFVTQAPFTALFRGVPGVAEVVGHDRHGGVAALGRTRRALLALGCDVAFDLQGNFKSALIARLSGCKQRIGAGARWRQEPWSRMLLTRCVTVPGPRHPALVATRIVRELAPAAPVLLPRLYADRAEVDRVASRVAASGIDPAVPFRVLVVGAAADCRSQSLAALRRDAGCRDLPVLLLAGPAESSVELPPGARVLRQGVGQLRELVGLGALLAGVGGSVVGCDRGSTHVLAAAGASTRVLFGPQDPAATAPPAATVLQHPDPPACMPCRSRRCTHRDGPVCMEFSSSEGRQRPSDAWLSSAE